MNIDKVKAYNLAIELENDLDNGIYDQFQTNVDIASKLQRKLSNYSIVVNSELRLNFKEREFLRNNLYI